MKTTMINMTKQIWQNRQCFVTFNRNERHDSTSLSVRDQSL
jgi:hypothetical protein